MARKSRKNVGLIGLGIIGSRVAAGLRAAGYHTFVWNRTPKPAPNFVGSPAEVAEICDIIQIFVADANATREVIDAFGDQLSSRHIIVSCGTIGPEATVNLAQLVQARGASFLDCPFTGSKGAAEKSQLVYYVGGDEAVFSRAKPVLEATSKAIVRCGRVGDASTLKVATNLISAVTVQTLAEALAIVKGAGIPAESLAAALDHNACKSGVIDLKLPKMVSGDYEPHFSVKHMFKDVQLGIHMANQQHLEVPLTTVAGGILYGALSNGWGDLDYASLYRVYTDNPPAADPATLVEADAAVKAELDALERADAEKTRSAAPAPEPPVKEVEFEVEPAAPTEPKLVVSPAIEAEIDPAKLEETAAEVPATASVNREEQTLVGDANPQPEAAEKGSPSEPAAPTSDVQKVEAITADAPVVDKVEVKAEDAKLDGPKSETVVKDGADAKEGGEAKPDEAVSTPSDSGDAQEEVGLSGFFSRVFRRKGAPVEK